MNDREAAYNQAQEHPYEQTRWQILINCRIIPRIDPLNGSKALMSIISLTGQNNHISGKSTLDGGDVFIN